MALSLPYDLTLDGGVNASHAQADLQVIANKFGTLVASDMPSLVLPTSQLSAANVEEIVEFYFNPAGPTGTVLPAASTTVPLGFSRIGTTGAYTIQRVSYAYTVITGGGTNGSISVRLGNVVSGSWTTTSTVVAAIALAGTVTAGGSASGDFSLSTTSFTGPLHIALMSEAAGATNIIRLKVTVVLTRGLQ